MGAQHSQDRSDPDNNHDEWQAVEDSQLSPARVRIALLGCTDSEKAQVRHRILGKEFGLNVYQQLRDQHRSDHFHDVASNTVIKVINVICNPRYHSVSTVLCKEADVIAFVFNTTNRKSFEFVDKDLIGRILDGIAADPVLLLVATHVNSADREISTEEGENYALTHDMMYFETDLSENSADALRAKFLEASDKARMQQFK